MEKPLSKKEIREVIKQHNKYESNKNLIIFSIIDNYLEFKQTHTVTLSKSIPTFGLFSKCYLCKKNIDKNPLFYKLPGENSSTFITFHEGCIDSLISGYNRQR